MEKTLNETESSSNEKMKIKIQTMDSVFQVEIGIEELVSDLKNKISTQYKIPIENQRLIYQGRLLQDNEKLSFYKINNDCVVHLVARALEQNVTNINNSNSNSINQHPNNQQEMPYEEIVPVIQIPFRSNRRRRRLLMPHYDISECFEAIYQNVASIDNIEKCKVEYKPNKPSIEPFDFRQTTYEVGQWVDVKDTIEQWLEAQVIQIRGNSQAYVHYNGWGTRWDEWIDFSSNRMRNFKTYTLQPPASSYMSPYPGIPCDLNVDPQPRSIDAFYYIEKCKSYIDNLSASMDRMLTLRKKNKEVFENNFLNQGDQEILFNATQLIPIMDRVGRMMEDISMLMSHLVVNPNLYPQMLLGYKKNELFKNVDLEALNKQIESNNRRTSLNPFFEEIQPIMNESRSAQLSPHRNILDNINGSTLNTVTEQQDQMTSSITSTIAELEENLQQMQQQYNQSYGLSNQNQENNTTNTNNNGNQVRPQQVIQVNHDPQNQFPNHTTNTNTTNNNTITNQTNHIHPPHNNNHNNHHYHNNLNAASSIQTNLGYNLSSSSNELPFVQRIISSYTQSDRILNPSSHVSNLFSKESLFPKVNLQSPSLLSPGEVMMMTGYSPYSEQNFDIYVHTIVSQPPEHNNTQNNNNPRPNPNTNNINNNANNPPNDNNGVNLNENNQTNSQNEFFERRISQPTPHIPHRINEMLGMNQSDTLFGNPLGTGTNLIEGSNSNNNPFQSENQLYKDEMTQTSLDEINEEHNDSYYSAMSKDLI